MKIPPFSLTTTNAKPSTTGPSIKYILNIIGKIIRVTATLFTIRYITKPLTDSKPMQSQALTKSLNKEISAYNERIDGNFYSKKRQHVPFFVMMQNLERKIKGQWDESIVKKVTNLYTKLPEEEQKKLKEILNIQQISHNFFH